MVQEGISLYYEHGDDKYEAGELVVHSLADGEEKCIPADIIVLSAGRKPASDLYDELIAYCAFYGPTISQ